MYKIKNLKGTPTPLSFPGRSAILQKLGDTTEVREREFDTPSLQACIRNRWVSCVKIEGDEPPEDTSSSEYTEYRRISRIKSAKKRAARRAAGELL